MDLLPVYIYGLLDPRTGLVRYVGKARNPKRRLTEHWKRWRRAKPSHKNNWLNVLHALDIKPRVVILHRSTTETWQRDEAAFIAEYRAYKQGLTNATDGWDGSDQRMVVVATHCRRGHEFTPGNTRKTATGRRCGICALEAQRAHREANQDALRAHRRIYKQQHADTIRATQKASNARYRAAKRDAVNAQKRVHYTANRDSILARQKAYRDTHPLEEAALRRSHYLQHRDAIRSRQKIYRDMNGDEIRAQKRDHYGEHRAEENARSRTYYANHQVECQARQKAYDDAHRAEKNAQAQEYRANNRAVISARQKERRAAKRAEINARCRDKSRLSQGTQVR